MGAAIRLLLLFGSTADWPTTCVNANALTKTLTPPIMLHEAFHVARTQTLAIRGRQHWDAPLENFSAQGQRPHACECPHQQTAVAADLVAAVAAGTREVLPCRHPWQTQAAGCQGSCAKLTPAAIERASLRACAPAPSRAPPAPLCHSAQSMTLVIQTPCYIGLIQSDQGTRQHSP